MASPFFTARRAVATVLMHQLMNNNQSHTATLSGRFKRLPWISARWRRTHTTEWRKIDIVAALAVDVGDLKNR